MLEGSRPIILRHSRVATFVLALFLIIPTVTIIRWRNARKSDATFAPLADDRSFASKPLARLRRHMEARLPAGLRRLRSGLPQQVQAYRHHSERCDSHLRLCPVSSPGQTLASQDAEFHKAVAAKVYCEKIFGRRPAARSRKTAADERSDGQGCAQFKSLCES